MEPWLFWLIVAIAGLVIAIIGVLWSMGDLENKIATFLMVFGFVALVGGGVAAGILGAGASEQTDQGIAAEQGLTIVGKTASREQWFYEVTSKGKCTINADKVDDTFVVIGSDPLIELTPDLVNYICYGGPS